MEKVRLGDVCEIQSGGTPSRANPDFWDNGTIPWVKISDFNGKYLNKTQESITQKGLDNSSAKLFEKGTILYTIFATLGETCILDIQATTNQAIAGIKVIDNRIEKDYLYNFLVSKKSYVNEIGRGVAQNNINLKILKSFEIPVLSIQQQKQILKELEKVTDLINKRKEQIKKLDELVKARFVELFGDVKTNKFGWEKCRFGDVATKITDGEHGTVPRVEKSEGYLYFMARNITKDGNIDLTETSYVPEEVHRKIYKRCNPETDDILLVCVGATIGKCTIVPKDFKEFSMARSVALIKPDRQKVNSTFLISLLKSDAIQNDISNCAHAAAQAGLYTNMIINLDAFLPPIELQNQFASFVEQTDKSKLEVQKSLEKLELLKKSLMQKYFG